jgi:16S rRNA (cytosine967-C5)-methyltransferase
VRQSRSSAAGGSGPPFPPARRCPSPKNANPIPQHPVTEVTLNARDVAFLTARDVMGETKRGAQSAFTYRTAKSGLDARDLAFAGELAYGSIKMRRLLDWYLKPYVGTRLKELPPSIIEILRLGVYQLRLMNGVEPHAAVYETVNLALRHGHRGTAGLVNAVLRRFDRENPPAPQEADFVDRYDYLATVHSLPTWLVKIYASRFGDERLEAILEGVNQRSQVAVTVNTAVATLDEAIEALSLRGLAAQPSAFVGDSLVVQGSSALLLGAEDMRYVQQSESAAMPVDLLDPKPGERVIEYCAGRGNKTLQIASRQHPEIVIEALELDERKAAQLTERLTAAKLHGVALVTGDALVVSGERAAAILVDAPCSANGIIGRHAEARWRKDPADAPRLAGVQTELLRAASMRLTPGGRLVYSVCSVDPREGEDVIAAVQASDPQLKMIPMPERYKEFEIAQGMLAVPPGIDGRDGFFLATLSR